MHPKSPIPCTSPEGDLVCYAREDIIKMCTNFEVTSLLQAAKEGEYDGLLHMIEDQGTPGFARWDNVALAKQWGDIWEEYERMRAAGTLVFDHKEPEVVPAEFPEHFLKIKGLDDAEIEIERNLLITRLDITAVSEAIVSWEDHQATDFISNTKLEGCTGFNHMTDAELIAEWNDCRDSFYRKAKIGLLKETIPLTDPEKDDIPVPGTWAVTP